MTEQASFDPVAILQVLLHHNVDFVVIGGIAGNLYGSNIVTNDLDICYSRDRENLSRLARALGEIGAKPRDFPPDLPFVVDEHALRLGDTFTFETQFGWLDCLGTPSGTQGYQHLRKNAVRFEVEDSEIWASSLDDLIGMKEAAGRDKDKWAVEALRVIKVLGKPSSGQE